MSALKTITNFLALLSIVIKRLWHNLGLSASALIGIVSVLAMVICVPIFSHNISTDVLLQQLKEQSASVHRRLFSFHLYYLDRGGPTVLTIDQCKTITQDITNLIAAQMSLPVERVVMEIHTDALDMKPVSQTKYDTSRGPLTSLHFMMLDIMPEYADITDGKWPEPDSSTAGPIKVAVSEHLADEMNLNVGDQFKVDTLEIEITGIWRERNLADPIWFESSPDMAYKEKLWIPEATYRARLENVLSKPVYYVSWYVIVNENNLNFQKASQYIRGIMQLKTEINRVLVGSAMDYSPLDALLAYQKREQALTTLFFAVGAPMIVLALLFIGLTSRIAVQQYEQEIATMRGRGTNWLQIVTMNLAESLILILLSAPLSLLAGWLGIDLMSNTASFLKFAPRQGFNFSLEGINTLWLGVAVALIVVTRLFPMLGSYRSTIVRMKQEQSRGNQRPFWERYYLDFMLLIPSVYAYLVMRGWTKSGKLLDQLQIGSEQFRDPLLFIAPALFIISACMIILRIVPLLMRLLAAVVERLPGVWVYLSLQQIARRTQDHASALLLIMISLSLAIFSASTAKTLDKWLNDSVYYKTGADLVLKEYIETTVSSELKENMAAGFTTVSQISYLDEYNYGFSSVELHQQLPGVINAARVGQYDGNFSFGTTSKTSCTIMGIDRLNFPQVAFYRSDFTSQPLGVLMNALGAEPMGVLIPTSLASQLGLNKGDHLTLNISVVDITYTRDAIVVGTYDYFPTVYPGKTPTFIMNLENIFDDPEAVVDYVLWLNLRPGTDIEALRSQIKQMIGDYRAVVNVVGNASDGIKAGQIQPERLGLFGVLNLGFLMTGLMPAIGFLLYSYASLRRRFIQLGILQAIGLSEGQMIGYLVLEQVLLMGVAIFSGAVLGLLTSVLFIPFLQTGAVPGTPVPPFQVLIGWIEAGWLSLGFGLVLFLTMLGTIIYLTRLKVFQAVKLGESL